MTKGHGQWAMGNRTADPIEQDWQIYPVGDDIDSGGLAEGAIADFRDLDVWKEGMRLAASTYQATAAFPREELYGLTSQMRRASVSIPTNIAEGYGRNSTGAYTRFLKIALGSVKELETQAELAGMLGFLERARSQELVSAVQRLSKMLRSLIRSIEANPR